MLSVASTAKVFYGAVRSFRECDAIDRNISNEMQTTDK